MTDIQLFDRVENPVDAITTLGTMFAKSGMFGCDRVEQGQVLAMACLTERKSPFEILNRYHIVEGRLSLKAGSALADFRKRGGKHVWTKTGDDGKSAAIQLTMDGQTITSEFSMKDAERMGLIKPRGSWEKSPANMMRARAISNGVAMLAPEIYSGDDFPIDESPAPTITLSTGAGDSPSTIAATVAPPAPVVETVIVEPPAPEPDEPELADMGLAPKPATLDNDLIVQLERAIGPDAIAAGRWLLAEGWLQPGEGFDKLTTKRAEMILERTVPFLEKVRAFAAKGVE